MTVSFTTSSTASTMSVSFPSRTALNEVGCALSAEKSTGPDRPQHKIAHGTSANPAGMRRGRDVKRDLTVRDMVIRWSLCFSDSTQTPEVLPTMAKLATTATRYAG